MAWALGEPEEVISFHVTALKESQHIPLLRLKDLEDLRQ